MVWCPICHGPYGASEQAPPLCPTCGQRIFAWLRSDPVPQVEWKLTRDDRVFLRVQKIGAD